MKIPISIPAETFKVRLIDIVVFLIILGILSFLIYIASEWGTPYDRTLEINLNPSNIPQYALQSVARIFSAYLLSLVFSIWYGYTASRTKIHEKIMIPLLDILQSIPVLSFLPGVVLAMIALFPGKRIGLELACILLIFTGQVWNMTFSFYHSISTIPKEMREVVKVFKFNKFSKFLRLDLPFSAIGLIWNSMMSVAGGWFFLMACEMFVLEDRDFRLPGLGSYIQIAANSGNIEYVMYGLGIMILLIIIIDLFIWRPLIVWCQKFRIETVPPEEERESLIFNIFSGSVFIKKVVDTLNNALNKIEKFSYREFILSGNPVMNKISKALGLILLMVISIIIIWAILKASSIVSSVSLDNILTIIKSAFYSLLRVSVALLIALAWTLPVGVYIGLNPRAAKMLQGIVQIAASVPATAIFPVILLLLIKLGGSLDIGAVFLMLLGTQWYLLFNIIAGASAIPKDLIEISRVYGIKGIRKWKTLILPGIFPYLVTGLITASGGAWNATIVSEYVSFGGKIMHAAGLGALISLSSASGNFGLLLLSTCFMSLIVVGINRLVWKRLFILAKTKYLLE
ncbi:ABC transporter permease [Thermodesulfovibrio thiophilus]|uniref:ABC transporter permease n=1 Tax=Thermodesulfovibrio thiophilus TaxID=340095 RepID=UPI0017AAFCB6|nr:ABC transporter permease subunit [Thermodesulfovibrio thiophilus]HHW20606.1 ABC transporter permease subunit [Thermodesulfovibrio thiophilus]